MAMELKLPELGENIEAGDVIKVLVSVGDTIRKDQALIEVETGKATVEVPAAAGGRVTAIHVKEGEKIKTGQLLVTLEVAETAGKSAAKGRAPSVPKGEAPAAPAVKPTVKSVTRVLAPAPVDVAPATAAPASETPAPPAATPATPALPTDEPSTLASPLFAAPSVRQFAREIGVDLREVSGSGPGGRISEEDVKRHARTRRLPPPPGVPMISLHALPDFSRFGPVRREAMDTVRLLTAQQVTAAWTSIPHVTQFDAADVTRLEELRKRHGAKAEARGGKLTLTAILLKAVAGALKTFPKFAASVDMVRHEMIYKQYCHIGVAVDTPKGLLVPVVRDVDQKNVLQLAVELSEIAARARERKLRPQDLEGGCFTITNLGGLGGGAFTPIINAPEAAILGVGRAALEPVYVDGELKPRRRLPLALSYDHRLIDGADGVRFLRWLVEALEEPFVLLLET